MEQNTEASQAVEERADMIAALSMCAAALAQGSNKRSRDIACEYACEALRRAALKAQPAPTEAAQYPNTPEIDALMAKWDDDGATRGAAFIELRDKARQLERAFYAAVEQVRAMAYAAQAEDSARLDAERLPMMNPACGCEACNPQMIGRMMFICKLCGDKRCPHVANHVNPCQGHARASAETGGVKT